MIFKIDLIILGLIDIKMKKLSDKMIIDLNFGE
jgi:hypothetical protein